MGASRDGSPVFLKLSVTAFAGSGSFLHFFGLKENMDDCVRDVSLTYQIYWLFGGNDGERLLNVQVL